MRVIQISDTHISAVHAVFVQNTDAVARWLDAESCTLVIHTGDISMDGAADEPDLLAAQAWNDQTTHELLGVPGNHDVGDHVAIKPQQRVDDARLARWRRLIGPDWWSIDRGGWRFIGLNAMLLGTHHAEEERQFDWLAEAVQTSSPIAIFLHKPLPEPRHRIMALIAKANVKLVASGHLHTYRTSTNDGVAYVWGPAASFVAGESQEELGGERKLGLVEHLFDSTGVTSRFIRPTGLTELAIEPYLPMIYPSIPQKAVAG